MDDALPGHGHTALLWLGSQFSDPEGSADDASSPAAIAWQASLLNVVRQRGCAVPAIGHIPYRSWPSGRLQASLWRSDDAGAECALQRRYLNVRGLRILSLAWHYYRAARSRIEPQRPPTAVLTYNAYPYLAIAAAQLQRRLSIPWINVQADPVRSHQHPLVARLIRPAGTIYLSWQAFTSSDSPQKLHLDGGVDTLKVSPPTHSEGRHAILYAGTLAAYTGLPLLMQAFAAVQRPDVDLWICGKGDPSAVLEASAADPRIKYKGFVSDSELSALAEQACAFVNPRPPEMAMNAANFPSKVLFYLRFGKPVISTATGGLGPDYRPAIIMADGALDIGSWIDRVVEACGSPLYRGWCATVQKLAAAKTWEVTAEKLIDFVTSVARSGAR